MTEEEDVIFIEGFDSALFYVWAYGFDHAQNRLNFLKKAREERMRRSDTINAIAKMLYENACIAERVKDPNNKLDTCPWEKLRHDRTHPIGKTMHLRFTERAKKVVETMEANGWKNDAR